MNRVLFQIMIVSTVGILLAACDTIGRKIETPAGKMESVDGNLNILRVVRKTTTTGNMRDARDGVIEEDILVSCPEGTVTAIPVLEQTAYGFGEIEPDDLSAMDARGVLSFNWQQRKQRPLGMYYSGVHVTDVNSPSPGGEQSVTLTISSFLSDKNFDDKWWHISSYHVLCLGNNPE